MIESRPETRRLRSGSSCREPTRSVAVAGPGGEPALLSVQPSLTTRKFTVGRYERFQDCKTARTANARRFVSPAGAPQSVLLTRLLGLDVPWTNVG
jgi:hypothetical protein